jgi:putative FmdB family regulatory protein
VPTYEYACNACGNRFELRQGFDSKPKAKCPQCGKIAPRMLSAPPILFKGTGFYKTDARGSDTSAGESSSKAGDGVSETPSVPDLGAAGHGHSHGPGGHTHDTAAPAATSKDAKSKNSGSDSKSKSDTKGAEAPAAG